MICAIHQPNFLPYIGLFDKYKKSDVFILYDTAQYSKNEFHNRNRIKTPNGPLWLTIPVHVTLGQKIGEVKVANTTFIKEHLRTIELNYKKSPFFESVFPEIERIYTGVESDLLLDYNSAFLKYFFSFFGDKKILYSSALDVSVDKKSTDALVEMLHKVEADTYLSGAGAKEYLDIVSFEKNNLHLLWQEFSHPVYHQMFGDFVENLSIIDVAFNVGLDCLGDSV